MEKKHDFYPMITGTVRELIGLNSKEDDTWFLVVLKNYPNIQDIEEENITPVLFMLIKELDRQYARWNKGGVK